MNSILSKFAFPNRIPVRAALTEIKVVRNEKLSLWGVCTENTHWMSLSLKIGKYFSYSLLFAFNGFINLSVDW